MNYDIILVTRNRKSILEISIPLMLKQRFLPQQFIVVDSSDDHSDIELTIKGIFLKFNAGIPLKILDSLPGTSLQRNVGLSHASSDIVMFPDDDSLWDPLYAESIMRIYEKDTEQLVGGVSGREVTNLSESTLGDCHLPYSMEMRDKIGGVLKQFKKFNFLPFTKDPVFLEGRYKRENKRKPDWLVHENAELSGPMTGFAMSFRTNLIFGNRFDEVLGGYALFEDYDASLRVMETHLIVKAMDAKVLHYRVPKKRTKGFEWGFMHVLNRTYIVCKSTARDSRSRRNIYPFSIYKCIRYFGQCGTGYGRQRFKGALHALRYVKGLIEAKPTELASAYVDARQRGLASNSPT